MLDRRPLALLALLTACGDDPRSEKAPIEIADDSATPTPDDPEALDPEGDELLPGHAGPYARDMLRSPGSITFTELMYHPLDGSEWVELHNPMAFDMDLSGWSLEGGITFAFPAGTLLPAGGYLVIAADPAAIPGALGPFSGRLANPGERLTLSNNAGRRIDSVGYDDAAPWPVGPDGSGFSLAKMDPDAASDAAESWTVSATPGGSPGADNGLDPHRPPTTLPLVDLEATWSYDTSGAYPASDWAALDYDDSAWPLAPALFYAGLSTATVAASVSVTADNYYALYLGAADGSDLRLLAADADGDWTTVETVSATLNPTDHLYLAAWEAPWDYGGPQMTIAEVETADRTVGTSALDFEWVLGPTGASPSASPPDPAPDVADIYDVVAEANAAADWDIPAAEVGRSSDPWGWAVSGAFTDAAAFVWPDTFSDTSITNTENTYALLRSVEPLAGEAGATALSAVPTTTLFRTPFTFDGDPTSATLNLSCTLDDGAVVYLNGVEVARLNMDSGPLAADTLASAPFAGTLGAALSTSALQVGDNVLAVELHQSAIDDPTLRFGCALSAQVASTPPTPDLLFSELPPADAAPYWVELVAQRDLDLDGRILASTAGGRQTLSGGPLAAGDLVRIPVDFPVSPGDLLTLLPADEGALSDAQRITTRLQGRDAQGWGYPAAESPGAPNIIDREAGIVIQEILYHAADLSTEGAPVTPDDTEWIELFNRSEAPIDLSGWWLVDAVAFTFPDGTVLDPGATLVVARDAAALLARDPSLPVIGDFAGSLDNDHDQLLLLDANGNLADAVSYHDDGRWPEAADGGGSSLELRDPWADNAAPEAWAASDEGGKAAWTTISYRGVANSSVVGPDGYWQELVLGLLDAGTVLIDDVHVIADPDTNPVEQIQNGAFDRDASTWRLLGNHGDSAVVPDPDDPANPVLRLTATGPTGHMHNHAETTLTQPISARTYAISFRARWVSGNNQLNSRLYFNRLPRTARIPRPEAGGTPGAPNSQAVANLGPTYGALSQDLAVPPPYTPVTFSLPIADPDGVAAATLWSSTDGGPFVSTPMASADGQTYTATLGGGPAGSIVQVYVEATDARGASTTFPAAGPDARALFTFDDGRAATNGLHNVRILMTPADNDWFHDTVNLMSDGYLGATVIYDEAEVFYDVGVRAKGSERGRPEVPRLGYGLRFSSAQPLRGSHGSALIDRSEGVGFGQRELLMNLVMTHAGSVSGEYNDLTQVIAPRAIHTGPAELQLDRFSGLVLDAQFPNGADSPLYEYELVYFPVTTDDGTAEGYKLPQPDGVVGTSITDLGADPEGWRWTFLLQNTTTADDYTPIQSLGQAFALGDPAFLPAVDAAIDVDQWLRAYAFATLSGAVDNYGGDGSQHNGQFYRRPDDGRILYFPHDLDFYGYAQMPVINNGDLYRLLAEPRHLRAYYGHLYDIITTAYNSTYLGPWCSQIGALLPAQDFAGHCAFIASRADWVMTSSPDAILTRFPARPFAITTPDGTVSSPTATLEGEGWIDVDHLSLNGAPLGLTWQDDHTFHVTVPLDPGANTLNLLALDRHGNTVGTDTVTLTRE